MSALKVLVLLPLWLLLTGFAYVASPSASPSPSPSASPTPSAPPTPVNAYISLDVTAGGASTTITVMGGSFNPGEGISIDWDKNPAKVLGNATADSSGNFNGVKVKPFAGAQPGPHQICASVDPQPCATFTLQGAPTPTPSAAPTPSESPSPSPSASASPTPTPVPIPVGNNTTTSGLDVLLQPPFIFMPFIAALALLGAIAYWFLGMRNREASIPSAAISHRSVRPGYGLSDYDIRPAPLGPTPGETTPPPAEGTDEAPPITES